MKRTTESLSGVLGRRRAAVRLWWLHTAGSCGPVSFTRRLDKSGLVAAGNSRSRSPTDRCSAASASVAASRHKPREWGITVNPVGAVLPNAARTPGAVNPSVIQANIDQRICASGWTATVRPPASFTTRLKKEQLACGYTYQGDTATRDYEEDHLISLEIGGAPTAEANLWPEPYNSPVGARVKDVVEGKLNALVCDHAITLAAAQRAIATNWWTSYLTYVGPAPAHQDFRAPAIAGRPSCRSALAPCRAAVSRVVRPCAQGG
jgi:hypothetical protein